MIYSTSTSINVSFSPTRRGITPGTVGEVVSKVLRLKSHRTMAELGLLKINNRKVTFTLHSDCLLVKY